MASFTIFSFSLRPKRLSASLADSFGIRLIFR
nr:MAG TPA: hypothetical protein [Caudoviricetes sp.]